MSRNAGRFTPLPDEQLSAVPACRNAAGVWLDRAGARLFPLLVFVVSALALAGCQPPEPPLMVGLNPWVGYDPLVLMREQGRVDPARLKVVDLSTNAEVLRHFRNGLLDAAPITLDQTLGLVDEGMDLRIVAVLDSSNGADVVMASPKFQAVQDLRGKRIAVEPSTVGKLVLLRMLESAGMTPADVTVVPLEASHHLPALRAGRVESAVSYEPLATQMRLAGFASVFDSASMDGEILDVLVVRADVLLRRPRDVEVLVRAWNAGLEAFSSDVSGAARTLAPATGMSVEEYVQTQAGLAFLQPTESLAYLSGSPPPIQLKSKALAHTLQDAGLLRTVPGWNRLLDPEPARRVLGERETP